MLQQDTARHVGMFSTALLPVAHVFGWGVVVPVCAPSTAAGSFQEQRQWALRWLSRWLDAKETVGLSVDHRQETGPSLAMRRQAPQ